MFNNENQRTHKQYKKSGTPSVVSSHMQECHEFDWNDVHIG